MLMNLTLNTKNFKLCYISFIPAQDRISGQYFNEIANMKLHKQDGKKEFFKYLQIFAKELLLI